MTAPLTISRCLWLGTLGAAISVTADLFLGYFPSGIDGFETPFTVSIDKVYTVLAQASHARLLASNYLSAIGIPLSWFGLFGLFLWLRQSNRGRAGLWFLIVGTIGILAGTIFHTSLSYTATLYRLSAGTETETIRLFAAFSQPFAFVFLAAILFCSGLLALVFATGPERSGLILSVLTPFGIELLIAGISYLTPLEVRTFLILSIYNMSLMLFFLLCLLLLPRSSIGWVS